MDDRQIAEAEAAIAVIAGRWALADVVAAGIKELLRVSNVGICADLLTSWLKLVRNEMSPRRHDEVRLCCWRFMKSSHGPKTTDGITRAVIREYIDTMGAPATRRNNRNALHRWFDWLRERGFLADNPASGVKVRRGRTEQGLPSVLTAKQAEQLMQTTEQPECRRIKGWLSLCLFAVLRPSEAHRLTWAEVDFESGEISVMGHKRGSKPRIIPMNDTVRAWLQAAKTDGEPTPGYFARLAQRIAANRAGIDWDEDILRHSYASYASGAGVPIHELAERMGNSPGTIYAHYRHPRPAAEVKAFWEISPAEKKISEK